MRDKIYFWLEDNCLAVKVRGGEFGLGLSADGEWLRNPWEGIKVSSIPTLDAFIRKLNELRSRQKSKRPHQPYRIKVKPDMEARYQSILSKLRPDPTDNDYLKPHDDYVTA